MARSQLKGDGLYSEEMDRRPSSALMPPVMTALEQWAALAKETHDALRGAGFPEATATDITVGLLRQG